MFHGANYQSDIAAFFAVLALAENFNQIPDCLPRTAAPTRVGAEQNWPVDDLAIWFGTRSMAWIQAKASLGASDLAGVVDQMVRNLVHGRDRSPGTPLRADDRLVLAVGRASEWIEVHLRELLHRIGTLSARDSLEAAFHGPGPVRAAFDRVAPLVRAALVRNGQPSDEAAVRGILSHARVWPIAEDELRRASTSVLEAYVVADPYRVESALVALQRHFADAARHRTAYDARQLRDLLTAAAITLKDVKRAAGRDGKRRDRRSVGDLYDVPPPPPHRLQRTAELAALKATLFGSPSKPVAVTGAGGSVGVHGMGGIGKSVLAATLVRDPDVRRAFADGIYWLTLGEQPNLLTLQNMLWHRLTGVRITFTDDGDGNAELRRKLEGKRALIVLDDVWRSEHLSRLLIDVETVRFLITTRNKTVLVSAGAVEHCVEALSPQESRELLADWAGVHSHEALPADADAIAKACGNLPLALSAVGAMVRIGTPWKDARALLQGADLDKIEHDFPGYAYPNLLRALAVSIDALDPSDRERYLDLAVFPDDQHIPDTTLAAYWGFKEPGQRGERAARLLMTKFAARSLATMTVVDGAASLELHDVLRYIARRRRASALPALHARLVEAWNGLPALPDTYAWRWLVHHLVEAGRENDVRRLLLDFEYLQHKLRATDVVALLADFGDVTDESVSLVQSAIRLSAKAIAQDPTQLAGQLFGRLVERSEAGVRELLSDAAAAQTEPWLRPIKAGPFGAGGPLISELEGDAYFIQSISSTADGRYGVARLSYGTLHVWDLNRGLLVHNLDRHRVATCIAVTPDDHRMVCGSIDADLTLWELERGDCIRTLKGHSAQITCVVVTLDGLTIVSGSADGTLRVWDIDGGTRHVLSGHEGSITSVSIVPDRGYVVSASLDGTLRVWDFKSGHHVLTTEACDSGILCADVTRNGLLAASGSSDRRLRVWNLTTGRAIRTTVEHPAAISCVSIAADASRVTSVAGADIRVWDLETGAIRHAIGGDGSGITCAALAPDGLHAVTGSKAGMLQVWDLITGRTVGTIAAHFNAVKFVTITADGKRAISGTSSHLRLWDISGRDTLQDVAPSYTRHVGGMATAFEPSRAVTGASLSMRVWDLASGDPVLDVRLDDVNRISSVAITADGRYAAAGGNDVIHVWDVERGEPLFKLPGYCGHIWCMVFGSGGVVYGSSSGTLSAWNFKTGRHRELGWHEEGITDIAISPDGLRAVSLSEDKTIRIWDVDSGKARHILGRRTRESDPIFCMAVSPDCRLAVSGSLGGTLRSWDLVRGRALNEYNVTERGINCVAVTPDGRLAVYGSFGGELRAWATNLPSDLQLQYTDHPAYFDSDGEVIFDTNFTTSVAITPDGRRAVCGTMEGILSVWVPKTGEKIASFTTDDGIHEVAITDDGVNVIACGLDGQLRVFRLIEAGDAVSRIKARSIHILDDAPT